MLIWFYLTDLFSILKMQGVYGLIVGEGEFSKVMQTRDVVEGLHNFLEFLQSL